MVFCQNKIILISKVILTIIKNMNKYNKLFLLNSIYKISNKMIHQNQFYYNKSRIRKIFLNNNKIKNKIINIFHLKMK